MNHIASQETHIRLSDVSQKMYIYISKNRARLKDLKQIVLFKNVCCFIIRFLIRFLLLYIRYFNFFFQARTQVRTCVPCVQVATPLLVLTL